MRVLQVSCLYPPYEFTGETIYVHDLSKEMAKQDDVFVFAGKLSPREEQYQIETDVYEGIPVKRIILNEFNFLPNVRESFYNPIVERRFIEYVEETKPDIIHFHSIQGLGASLISAAKKKKKPVILTLHDFWFLCQRQFFILKKDGKVCDGPSLLKCINCVPYRSKLFILLNMFYLPFRYYYLRKILKQVDKLISPSKFVAQQYIRFGASENKIIISRSGINTHPFGDSASDPKSRSRIRFGMMGGTEIVKGFMVLIDAFKRINNFNSYEICIWGNINRTIATTVKRRYPNLNIKFPGTFEREDVAAVLRNLDVVIVPSTVPESFSLVVAEALAAKVPVIAANIGALPEAIEHGKNGLLFSVNSYSALYQCIDKVIKNPSITQEFRDNIKLPKTIREQTEEIREIYQNLIREYNE